MDKRLIAKWLLLGLLALVIKLFSLSADAVETYYSRGIYPYISVLQRSLLGWLPFSLGDVLYLLAGVYALYALLILLAKLVKRRLTRQEALRFVSRSAFILLIVYIWFNLCWGLNYNRQSMAAGLGLKMETYTTDDLAQLIVVLTDTLNNIDSTGVKDQIGSHPDNLFKTAGETYQDISLRFHELEYNARSVKPSLYGYLGNYMGISGYYNPFTGEAQVNTRMPVFVQPFVICHEIGHQLGYAKEDEANFAGFLSARSSPVGMFRYSAYFDMYAYARREMYLRDSTRMLSLHQRLRPDIKNDFIKLREFYLSYKNPLEPLFRRLYTQYLKANQQPSGMMSYNEVVAMLIAAYKKEGFL